MYGDYSRFTFNSRRNYNRVYMQQGRVQIDADWNEQADIVAWRERTQLADVVGPTGSPAGSRGFAIDDRAWLVFHKHQYAEAVDPVPFTFSGRQPFTLESRVGPVSPAHAPHGPLFSKLDARGRAGYALQIDADGTVVFHRLEYVLEAEIELIAEVAEVGSVEVVELEAEVREAQRVYMRKLRSFRPVRLDQASHVVSVFDGRSARIYIDGELCAFARQCLPTASIPQTPFLIGTHSTRGRWSPGSEWFLGRMGEMRIWNVAREADEIRDHAFRLPPNEVAGLVAWYRQGGKPAAARSAEPAITDTGAKQERAASEAETARLPDSSGNGNDAVLRSTPPERLPETEHEICLERGRYYVDGILCQNPEHIALNPSLDGLRHHFAGCDQRPQAFIAYLDVWEHVVTYLTDPAIRDVALGGADTATRVQAVSTVRFLPVAFGADLADADLAWSKWNHHLRQQRKPARMTFRHIESGPSVGNRLYLVQLHDGGSTDDGQAEGRWVVPSKIPVLRLDSWPPAEPWRRGQVIEVQTGGHWRAGLIVSANPGGRELTLDASVEDYVNDRPVRIRHVPTFKWSRDNGAVALAIDAIDSEEIVLAPSGANEWDVQPGDWVEIVDGETALSQHANPLMQILEIDRVRGRLRLSNLDALVHCDVARRPFIRKWDQPGAAGNKYVGVMPIRPGVWCDLEDGLQIQFAGDGVLRVGDYWQAVTRTATNSVEWPVEDGLPQSRPPNGIDHHYAPLALIQIQETGPRVRASYHKTFYPLTEVTREEGEFLKLTGGGLTGPLRIEPEHPSAQPPLAVGGGRIRGRLEPGMVDTVSIEDEAVSTEKIRDHSVTRRKLAFPIPDAPAGLPSGATLLMPRPNPPEGFRYTGSIIFLDCQDSSAVRIPAELTAHCGLRAAGAGDSIYVLSDDGPCWRVQPEYGVAEAVCPLPDPRRGFAAAGIEDRIYVVGGYQEGRDFPNTLEYHPHTDSWSERCPMKISRAFLAAAAVGDRILAIGGERRRLFRFASAVTEEYTPRDDVWRFRRPMPTRRAHLGAGVLGDRVFVFGGERELLFGLLGVWSLRVNEEFVQSEDQWRPHTPMRSPRSRLGVSAIGDRVYAAVGAGILFSRWFGLNWTRSTEAYLPRPRQWKRETQLEHRFRSINLVTLGNRLYSVGLHHEILIAPVMAMYYVCARTGE